MSGYRGHLAFYLLVVAAAYYALSVRDPGLQPGLSWPVSVAVGCVYSLLPDLDSPSSKIRVTLTLLLLSFVAFALTYSLIYGSWELVPASIAALAAFSALWFTHHRGILHTPGAGLALSAPLILLGPDFLLMALLGYLSHLLMDGRLFG